MVISLLPKYPSLQPPIQFNASNMFIYVQQSLTVVCFIKHFGMEVRDGSTSVGWHTLPPPPAHTVHLWLSP